TYSVPSRLIGHRIEARLHPDIVEVYYRDELVLTMPRLHGERDHSIDYRHVIWSLVRKPGAFARYRYREDLFPSLTFRRAYDSLVARRGDRADVEYVRILHLAASTMESLVEAALVALLDAGESFDYAAVKTRCAPEPPAFPSVEIGVPDLGIYDRLLAGGAA
ncbi:MAG: Mu transposase domain-containing protein, partial [Steroidobacteraceae bacterium]